MVAGEVVDCLHFFSCQPMISIKVWDVAELLAYGHDNFVIVDKHLWTAKNGIRFSDQEVFIFGIFISTPFQKLLEQPAGSILTVVDIVNIFFSNRQNRFFVDKNTLLFLT